MFQLDKAIDNLTSQIASCSANMSADEIKDHLLSTVEDLVEHGSTEEEAYQTAVERIGNIAELKNELNNIHKERSFMNYRNPAFQQIITALFFAGAMLASAWLGFSDTVTYLLIAIWFIPFLLISKRSSTSAKDELHCLARKLHLK
ncbi:MAG: permease prefix domain 1-containing protein [Calditrichia bacterium]